MVSYFSHYNGNICNHQQQATANSSNISIVSNSSSNSDSMNIIQTCKRIAGNAGVETTSAMAEELQQQQQELLPKSGDDSNCDHSKLHRVIEEL